jgi:hypothetical protein
MSAVTGEAEPLSFADYARRIGKSRPYVSKLVAEGRITGRSMTPDRKIIPHLADEDVARGADPSRRAPGAAPLDILAGDDATYARQRTRKAAADAETAEIELRKLKGALIDRTLVSQTLGPWIRELRDGILGAPRDTVLDPVQAADCEAELAKVLSAFSARLATMNSETLTDGGAAAAS